MVLNIRLVMISAILILVLIASAFCADQVTYIDYGGKVPSKEAFDVRFNYYATNTRDCEIALKKPSENWKTYAYKKISLSAGQNIVKSVTLRPSAVIPVGTGYVVEVKILVSGTTTQTAYSNVAVNVEAGKQGFHVYNGDIYDANESKFLIRGVNNAHIWWYNDAMSALPSIAATGSNTVRIVWSKYSMTNLDLEKVIIACINNKMVPMVELHDATGSNDANKLLEMAQWWVDNVWLLVKYRKYIIVNIANEWSQWGTDLVFWKNTYKSAVSLIRNAGFSGTLVIDASAYGQNPNGPKQYGQELLNSDPLYNLVFSVHMYVEWSNEQHHYNISAVLTDIRNRSLPFIIGEFADQIRDGGNYCSMTTIDYYKIMSECLNKGFGYIGWSWRGNGYDGCGSLSFLDMANSWTTSSSFSTWGKRIINTATYGIRATSKKATIF